MRIADVISVFDFLFIISGIASFIMIYIFLSFTYRDALLLLNRKYSWIFVILIFLYIGPHNVYVG